ncbi:MAG TPA: hypothetical protein VM364_14935 [Vicinamibacterales bacterium]|nr:hypothetical protein [Vicinamibacterales bacterium]
MKRWFAVLLVACAASACSDPEKERIRKTTVPTYDPATGRLKELTYDSNKNGVIDTWTQMDGARPVMSKIDRDEDGIIDRWEYYDADGKLSKVGFSRADDGKVDAWAFSTPDGQIERVEISSVGDEKRIDRWERYRNGVLVESEEDTNGDGRPDKWETYENGAVKTVAFDENHDGRPDRRLVYEGGDLVVIESEPDASGAFTRRIRVR